MFKSHWKKKQNDNLAAFDAFFESKLMVLSLLDYKRVQLRYLILVGIFRDAMYALT